MKYFLIFFFLAICSILFNIVNLRNYINKFQLTSDDEPLNETKILNINDYIQVRLENIIFKNVSEKMDKLKKLDPISFHNGLLNHYRIFFVSSLWIEKYKFYISMARISILGVTKKPFY